VIQPPDVREHHAARQEKERTHQHRQEPVVAPATPAPVLGSRAELVWYRRLILGLRHAKQESNWEPTQNIPLYQLVTNWLGPSP
jgi:hypothetical protein